VPNTPKDFDVGMTHRVDVSMEYCHECRKELREGEEAYQYESLSVDIEDEMVQFRTVQWYVCVACQDVMDRSS